MLALWHDREVFTILVTPLTGAIMSGRRLGRLFGSLLLFAALAGVAVVDSGLTELHPMDVIWM
ncbi:hypothetical protein ONA70_27895 [Micromonospora yasonensis]|uniref:hypothetical protein n=1 Tax=Micromonospora yasonensis TaxID=1128667 RepID=UPI00222FF39B|nr:hypothetical protein [Micromonospora yasonensis]MCW3843925.1 hypothetical protein [Micromonospora yasonensis]